MSIIDTLHFYVFNATDNLKSMMGSHSFLDLDENFTKLKIGEKNMFWYVFENVFCHSFTFNESVGLNSAW